MTRNAKNRLLPLVVAVAGATLSGLQNFRFQSPSFFPFTLPPNDILKGPKGGAGYSASDGYWMMLKPLSTAGHSKRRSI